MLKSPLPLIQKEQIHPQFSSLEATSTDFCPCFTSLHIPSELVVPEMCYNDNFGLACLMVYYNIDTVIGGAVIHYIKTVPGQGSYSAQRIYSAHWPSPLEVLEATNDY